MRAVKQWFGTYLGKVSNNRSDGWAQLRVPQVLGTAQSNWARPMGAAVASPPAIGKLVVVMFMGGDINHPVYDLTSQETG